MCALVCGAYGVWYILCVVFMGTCVVCVVYDICGVLCVCGCAWWVWCPVCVVFHVCM